MGFNSAFKGLSVSISALQFDHLPWFIWLG